jgi:hypothetical protein
VDLEDLMKGKHHHGHDQHDYAHGQSDYHHCRGHHHGSYRLEKIKSTIRTLPHKKALLTGLIILCILIVIFCFSVVWAMLPFLSTLLDLVQEKGIQGVLETLSVVIQKIWKGNG